MSAAVQILEQPGDVLSPSSTNKYLSCSARYYFSKIERLPDPPTGALALGSAVHHALGANFSAKLETREDLPTTGVVALFREAWQLKLAGEMPGDRDPLPVEFRDDERPDELRAMGEALVTKYMDEAAPKIEPAAVEIHVAGRLGGVMVQGYIDLLDVNGRIVDVKTAARKPSAIDPTYRLQVATYAQLTPGASGEARLDTLTKTKAPAIIEQSFRVNDADFAATEKLYPVVQRAIRAGVFTPNRGSNLCSRRYCAFWRACEREFGGCVE